jgi:hypothetical protein
VYEYTSKGLARRVTRYVYGCAHATAHPRKPPKKPRKPPKKPRRQHTKA